MPNFKPVLAVFALVTACGGSGGVDGPTVGTDIQMRAGADGDFGGPDGIKTETGDNAELTIAHAVANVRDIELYFADPDDDDVHCDDLDLGDGVECDDNEKIVIEGPFEVDLLTGAADPSLEDVELPALVYDRVDVRIDDNEDDIAFEAEATLEDGQDVVISLDFNEDARFEDDDGIDVSGGPSAIIMALDVDDWLADIPLAGCIADGDVEIKGDTAVIDEDTSGSGGCSDVENRLKDNIKSSGELMLE